MDQASDRQPVLSGKHSTYEWKDTAALMDTRKGLVVAIFATGLWSREKVQGGTKLSWGQGR
jgi:hypothetical protein